MNDLYIGDALQNSKNAQKQHAAAVEEGRFDGHLETFSVEEFRKIIFNEQRLLPKLDGSSYTKDDPFSDSASIYFDRTANRFVYDEMDPHKAMQEIQGADFVEGNYGENINNQKYWADMMFGHLPDWARGTSFEIPDEYKEMMFHFSESTSRNYSKWLEASKYSFPFVDLLYSDPQDLFSIEQEGFDAKTALEELREANPELYSMYAYAFGSVDLDKDGNPIPVIDNLLTLALEARDGRGVRNSYELLATLNSTIHMAAMGKAIEVWERDTEQWEKWRTYAKNFVINSIVDDPDMLAEMVVSGVITLSTFGLGAASFGLTALSKANAIRKVAVRGKRLSNLILDAASGINKTQWAIRGIGNVAILENLPTTLLYKTGRFGRRLQKNPLVNKFTMDVVEGGLSGASAEIFNQRKKVMFQEGQMPALEWMKKADWHSVAVEAGMEAAISWALNPIIGGAFTVAMNAPTMGVGLAMNVVGAKDVKKQWGLNFRKMIAATGTERINASINLQRALNETGVTLEQIQGGNHDGTEFHQSEEFMAVLEVYKEGTDLTDSEVVSILANHLGAIQKGQTKGTEVKNLSTSELAVVLADRLFADLEGKKIKKEGATLETVREVLDAKLSVLKEFREKGREGETFESYVQRLVEEGAYFDHLDPTTRAATRERMGDEAFEAATDSQKLDTAIKVQEEAKTQTRKNIEEAYTRLNETEAEAAETISDITGEDYSLTTEVEPEVETEAEVEAEAEAEVEADPEVEVETDAEPEVGEADAETDVDVEADTESAIDSVEADEGLDIGGKPKEAVGKKKPASRVRADLAGTRDGLKQEISEGNLTPDERKTAIDNIQRINEIVFRLEKDIDLISNLEGLDAEGARLQRRMMRQIEEYFVLKGRMNLNTKSY